MKALLHDGGGLALAIICLVLFVEELGVPVPVLPGDGLLICGGIVVAVGGVHWAAYVVAATGAMLVGALGCYAWTSRAGPPAVAAVGRRLHCEPLLARGMARLHRSGSTGVFVLRMIPGMRVYATMIAGSARMPVRTYLSGLGPAILCWVIGFGLLGGLLGTPVLRAVGRVERTATIGALFLALALLFVVAAHTIPAVENHHRARSWRLAPRQAVLACGLDLAAVTLAALVVRELLMVVRHGLAPGLLPTTALAAILAIVYLGVTRRLVGPTPGELVLGVSYRSPLLSPPV